MNEEIYDIGFTFREVRNTQGQIVHGGTNRIGDRLIFSGIPQMYYEQTGKKVVDLDDVWFWDENPYVVRNAKVKSTVPLQMIADKSTFHDYLRNMPNFLSIVDKYCAYLGLECTLRHPRLYRYEGIDRIPNKIVLCTQGNLQGHMMGESKDRVLSDEVIEQIRKNYKKYNIVQIGTINDKKANGDNIIDCRGLDIWDSAKEIAESSMYIGVNTGTYWIANCYPHISKKVILCEYSYESLKYFIPMNVKNHHTSWQDWGTQFFNIYEKDCGVTTSFKKI
jgi:hypothetical protein